MTEDRPATTGGQEGSAMAAMLDPTSAPSIVARPQLSAVPMGTSEPGAASCSTSLATSTPPALWPRQCWPATGPRWSRTQDGAAAPLTAAAVNLQLAAVRAFLAFLADAGAVALSQN